MISEKWRNKAGKMSAKSLPLVEEGDRVPSKLSTVSVLEDYKRTRTVWEVFCITSFNFPFGAICGPMGT